MNSASAFAGSPRFRRLRNASLILVALLAAHALLGFFVVPWFVKPKIESAVTAALGRPAMLGRLEFNPFTLRARLSDFSVADRSPEHPLFRFDTMDVRLSPASLWKWAPVLDDVRLSRPRLELARSPDGAYNIQDIVDRPRATSSGAPPAFSINNIEIDDGSVSLDDQQHRRSVAVTQLGIGIPFLSSLPHDAEIRVSPKLSGAIDGARFDLAGTSSTPFADTEEATLDLNLDALPLTRYVAYAPLPHGLKLTDGNLTTRLTLAFVTEHGAPRSLQVTGTAKLDRLAIARSDNSPLVAAKAIEVALDKFDPFGHSLVLKRVAADAPEADLRRFADGTLELDRLLDAPAPAGKGAPAGGKAPAAVAPQWSYSIADLHVANGVLRLSDEAVTPAFRSTLSNVAVDAKKIASRGSGTVDVAFDSNTGAHFGGHGDVDVAGKAARGHFSLKTFNLALLYPYYADALNLDVRKGALDMAGDFMVDASAPALRLTLAQGAAALSDVELAVTGETDPLWRVPHADLDGIVFDLAKRSVVIDRIESQRPAIRLIRQADGVINFARLVRTTATTGTATVPAPSATSKTAATAAAGGEWTLLMHKLLLDHVAADFEDRAVQPPAKLKLADARIAAENLSNARGARGSLNLATRVGSAGRVQFVGALATNPVSTDGRISASGLDLVSLRPYFEARTNVVVTSGALGLKGRLTFDTSPPGPGRATYAGDVSITDFGSLDRPTSQELLRWKSLSLSSVDAASEPFKLALATVALDQFYARIIVNPDATLNLQRLLAPEAAAADASGGESAAPTQPTPPAAASISPTPPANAPATTAAAVSSTSSASPARTSMKLAAKPAPKPPGTAAAEPPKESPASEQKDLPVSIGRIEVSHGEVQFSDFFVKPNYSAHLTEVAGNVSALSATQSGDVELTARVESTASVDIRGSVNPFARGLTLDLTATAKDIDLPPLTPYSAKYAGYGIQKGKLSAEAHYKIDDRKLAASNKLVLDQLTFGEHVDSPTATKLPVLLAVALLKDRQGVIHLDLPIQGSLDDPKFSVGHVIIQIIVNLLTKIVTAPFAVLGAMVGGAGGEQLAYVEFVPGRAELSAESETKLRTLAKALADRPSLELDAAGRASPDADRDGLKRVALDHAMRLQKEKALVAKGESAPSVDTIKIEADEYPKYLEQVYRDTSLPDKPRNALRIPKDIPPAEMEALLLASYPADDEALRSLANRRALAVKEWFVGPGSIASERVFVVAPKVTTEGITDKGAPTRVDFAMH